MSARGNPGELNATRQDLVCEHLALMTEYVPVFCHLPLLLSESTLPFQVAEK